MDNLKVLRSRIDILDDQIMDLLNKRFKVTNQIGQLKKVTNKVVLDENREQIIINKMSNYSHYPQISTIYKTIMEESKKAQRR